MNAPMTSPCLDPTRVDELIAEIGEEDLAEVMVMFLTEAEAEIAKLTMGLDDVGYSKATHFIRSGAVNIGLKALADEAARAEATPLADRRAVGQCMAGIVARTRAAIAQRWG